MSRIAWSIGSWRFAVERTLPAPAGLALAYDRAAWRWHSSIRVLGYCRAYQRLLERLQRDGSLHGLGTGARVLDAGVGSAALSVALVNALPNVPQIHGIDLSPRMLAQARARLRRLPRLDSPAQLRLGDVNALPYPDAGFDMVMSAHLLEHSAAPAQVIAELVRVLRPGAPLLFVTTRANAASAAHGLHWRYRPLDPRRLHGWLDGAGLRDLQWCELGGRWSLPGRLSDAILGYKDAACGHVPADRFAAMSGQA